MPKGSLECCIYCGRDTARQGRICGACCGYGGTLRPEMKGRKHLPPMHHAGSPIDFVELEEKDHPNAIESYHGDTIRDDI